MAGLLEVGGFDDPDGSLMGESKRMTINLLAVGCVIPKENGCEIVVQGRPLWIETEYVDFCKAMAEAHGLTYDADGHKK